MTIDGFLPLVILSGQVYALPRYPLMERGPACMDYVLHSCVYDRQAMFLFPFVCSEVPDSGIVRFLRYICLQAEKNGWWLFCSPGRHACYQPAVNLPFSAHTGKSFGYSFCFQVLIAPYILPSNCHRSKKRQRLQSHAAQRRRSRPQTAGCSAVRRRPHGQRPKRSTALPLFLVLPDRRCRSCRRAVRR